MPNRKARGQGAASAAAAASADDNTSQEREALIAKIKEHPKLWIERLGLMSYEELKLDQLERYLNGLMAFSCVYDRLNLIPKNEAEAFITQNPFTQITSAYSKAESESELTALRDVFSCLLEFKSAMPESSCYLLAGSLINAGQVDLLKLLVASEKIDLHAAKIRPMARRQPPISPLSLIAVSPHFELAKAMLDAKKCTPEELARLASQYLAMRKPALLAAKGFKIEDGVVTVDCSRLDYQGMIDLQSLFMKALDNQHITAVIEAKTMHTLTLQHFSKKPQAEVRDRFFARGAGAGAAQPRDSVDALCDLIRSNPSFETLYMESGELDEDAVARLKGAVAASTSIQKIEGGPFSVSMGVGCPAPTGHRVPAALHM